MAKVNKLLFLPPILFLALGGLFIAGMQREAPGEMQSAFIGKPAPNLPDVAVEGTELLVAEDLAKGDVTIINFWASWCPPCRAEHPTLLKLAADGYNVAGMNFRDAADAASQYLIDDGNPFFATGFDPRGRISIDWGVAAPPETFIIGPDGTVLDRFAGPLVGSDYEQRFLPMLERALAK